MRPFAESTLKLAKVAGAVSATCELNEAELSKIEISGVTHNDSQVESGDLFIAIPGANRHGAEFAMSAVSKGAVAVLTDSAGAAHVKGVPVLVVADPRRVAGHIAALLYNEPMRDLASIGITGTNGKTTVSTLIYQIFQAAGRDSGLMELLRLVLEKIQSIVREPHRKPQICKPSQR